MPIALIQIFISILSMALGLFLFCKPALAIELQRRFYAKINWRMEPISMPKEIRNTRCMGLFIIVAGIITFIYAAAGLI